MRAFAAFAIFATILSADSDKKYVLATSPGSLNYVLSQYNLALVEVIKDGVYEVSGSQNVVPASLINAVSADPAVTSFESDHPIRATETKAQPALQPAIKDLGAALSDTSTISYYGATVRNSYVNQPAAAAIEVPAALNQYGAGNTVVAVIDSGVDATHPALQGVLVPGYDFLTNTAGIPSDLADLDQSTVAILEQSTVAILEQATAPFQLSQSTVAILEQSTVAILEGMQLPADFGHGTMVSGLIHLVAPQARIMPLRAFHADGTGLLSDVVRAIYYAVDNGASVINMSFDSFTTSPQLRAAIAYADAHNVICVASAGNQGQQTVVYPASYNSVVGVGSIDARGRRSAFSNFGSAAANTSAPGEALVTTYPGGHYAGVWGTSFSAALVSGTAALMQQVAPHLDPNTAFVSFYGHGKRVNSQGMGNSTLDILPILSYVTTPHQSDDDE